jgi:hypothetical protein
MLRPQQLLTTREAKAQKRQVVTLRRSGLNW